MEVDPHFLKDAWTADKHMFDFGFEEETGLQLGYVLKFPRGTSALDNFEECEEFMKVVKE